MSSENKGHRTQITIALIGLAGVLGGALIANWDKVFSPEAIPTQTITKSVDRANAPPADPTTTNIPSDQTASHPGATVQDDPVLTGTYVGISTEGVTRSTYGQLSRVTVSLSRAPTCKTA